MPPSGPVLPELIRQRLTAFARTRRRALLLRAAAETVVYFSLATLVAGLVIWLGRLAMPSRVAVSALVYGGALAVFGWRGVRPLAGRVRLFDIARQFEAAAGGRLGERVMSAVELAEGQPPGTSLWMTRRTISLAAREIGRASCRERV